MPGLRSCVCRFSWFLFGLFRATWVAIHCSLRFGYTFGFAAFWFFLADLRAFVSRSLHTPALNQHRTLPGRHVLRYTVFSRTTPLRCARSRFALAFTGLRFSLSDSSTVLAHTRGFSRWFVWRFRLRALALSRLSFALRFHSFVAARSLSFCVSFSREQFLRTFVPAFSFFWFRSLSHSACLFAARFTFCCSDFALLPTRCVYVREHTHVLPRARRLRFAFVLRLCLTHARCAFHCTLPRFGILRLRNLLFTSRFTGYVFFLLRCVCCRTAFIFVTRFAFAFRVPRTRFRAFSLALHSLHSFHISLHLDWLPARSCVTSFTFRFRVVFIYARLPFACTLPPRLIADLPRLLVAALRLFVLRFRISRGYRHCLRCLFCTVCTIWVPRRLSRFTRAFDRTPSLFAVTHIRTWYLCAYFLYVCLIFGHVSFSFSFVCIFVFRLISRFRFSFPLSFFSSFSTHAWFSLFSFHFASFTAFLSRLYTSCVYHFSLQFFVSHSFTYFHTGFVPFILLRCYLVTFTFIVASFVLFTPYFVAFWVLPFSAAAGLRLSTPASLLPPATLRFTHCTCCVWLLYTTDFVSGLHLSHAHGYSRAPPSPPSATRHVHYSFFATPFLTLPTWLERHHCSFFGFFWTRGHRFIVFFTRVRFVWFSVWILSRTFLGFLNSRSFALSRVFSRIALRMLPLFLSFWIAPRLPGCCFLDLILAICRAFGFRSSPFHAWFRCLSFARNSCRCYYFVWTAPWFSAFYRSSFASLTWIWLYFRFSGRSCRSRGYRSVLADRSAFCRFVRISFALSGCCVCVLIKHIHRSARRFTTIPLFHTISHTYIPGGAFSTHIHTFHLF